MVIIPYLIVKNVIQTENGKMISVDVCKKYHSCKKDYIWNFSTCTCKNGAYLKSIIDDSDIVCYEIISVVNTDEVK